MIKIISNTLSYSLQTLNNGRKVVTKWFLFHPLPTSVGTAGGRAGTERWHPPGHLRGQSHSCSLGFVAISVQSFKGHYVSIFTKATYFEMEPSKLLPSLSVFQALLEPCS